MAELSQADIERIVATHAPGFVVVPEPDAIPAAPDSDATAPGPARAGVRGTTDGGGPDDTVAVDADPLIAVRIRPAVVSDGPSPPLTRTVIVNKQTGRVEAEQG